MSVIAGLDFPVEHGTGTWDWNMGLEHGTGTRDWNIRLEHGTGTWDWNMGLDKRCKVYTATDL